MLSASAVLPPQLVAAVAWEEQLRRRDRRHAQVLIPDQRGHGRSDYCSPATWTLMQWADDVRAFTDALDLDRPIVLGVSFGGFVAQTYAAAHPAHPRGLILVSCGPRFAREHEVATAQDVAAHAAGSTGNVESAPRPAEAARVRLDALRIQTMDVNGHFEPEGLAPGADPPRRWPRRPA